MSMDCSVRQAVAQVLTDAVRGKLANYSPETSYMPFHHRLLGKDRYAVFSFIHSFNTTFGMCIWEQVAVVLARSAGFQAERQYKLYGEVAPHTEELIDQILNDLRGEKCKAQKDTETARIRSTVKGGSNARKHPDSVVDLFIKKGKAESYFDITTAKPNMKDFLALKRKLLMWDALRFSVDKGAEVFTALGIPYNPYHPHPYERFTLRDLYDLKCKEVMVGSDFWNFVAGRDIYEDLLCVFREVGDSLRQEIDDRFRGFR